MSPNTGKEGITVKQIEEFTKKHRFAVFFCALFVLACVFSNAFWHLAWSIIAISAGSVIGVLFAGKVEYFAKQIFHFVFKQEQVTQLILAIVGLVLAILAAPLIFLAIGLHGGKDMRHLAAEIASQHKP